MRKLISLLIAVLLLASLGVTAFAEGDGDSMRIIVCPEQEFSTLCRPEYSWKFTPRDGVTIYTEHQNSIPYVLVFRSEDWIVDVGDYIREQFTPQMKKQYGADLLSVEEFDQYSIGGRLMPAARYSYRLQGHVVEMLRGYDTQNGHTVVFTAKYLQDKGEATLEALDHAAAYYRPDVKFYSDEFNSRWRYFTAMTSAGDTVYLFDEVFVSVPADWAGKYDVVVSDYGVTFYHSLSRRLWNSRDDSEGGLLFSLAWSDTEDFRMLPSYKELGTGESGWYYLMFPTDYQAYPYIKTAEEEYSSLYRQIDFVRENSFCFRLDALEMAG